MKETADNAETRAMEVKSANLRNVYAHPGQENVVIYVVGQESDVAVVEVAAVAERHAVAMGRAGCFIPKTIARIAETVAPVMKDAAFQGILVRIKTGGAAGL